MRQHSIHPSATDRFRLTCSGSSFFRKNAVSSSRHGSPRLHPSSGRASQPPPLPKPPRFVFHWIMLFTPRSRSHLVTVAGRTNASHTTRCPEPGLHHERTKQSWTQAQHMHWRPRSPVPCSHDAARLMLLGLRREPMARVPLIRP